MHRRVLLTILAAATVTFGVITATAAAPGPSQAILAQDEETGTVFATEHLVLGERYRAETWELEVQEAIVAPSPERYGFSEVRVSAALRTIGGPPVTYEWAALSGIVGFPELEVVDSAGEIWGVTVTEPGNAMLPGSNLVSIEPYIPARWTVGFEVPTSQADELFVTATHNGQIVADWDLLAAPVAVAGWEAPPGAEVIAVSNPTMEWDGSVDMTIIDFGTTACDAASLGNVTTGFAMQVEVTTDDTRPGLFPNVRSPEPTAIAVWRDGASARMNAVDEFDFFGVEDEAVNARNHEQVIVPPGAPVQGFVSFLLPRDTRFADPLEPPVAVIFYPPGDAPHWYDISGSGTVAFDEGACDNIIGGPPFEVTG